MALYDVTISHGYGDDYSNNGYDNPIGLGVFFKISVGDIEINKEVYLVKYSY